MGKITLLTNQREYRSQPDEVLKEQLLTKRELTEVIELSYREIMRLDIELQQKHNNII